MLTVLGMVGPLAETTKGRKSWEAGGRGAVKGPRGVPGWALGCFGRLVIGDGSQAAAQVI